MHICSCIPYLMEIPNNYLQDRRVIYLTDDGEKAYIAQGTVLRSLL